MRELRQVAERLDWAVVEEFVDQGISGAKGRDKRPALDSMLKAVIRGHSYAIVPVAWTNRSWGESKLGLKEMGSRYLFSMLYAFLEDHLTRGDYRRQGFDPRAGHGRAPALPTDDAERGADEPGLVNR